MFLAGCDDCYEVDDENDAVKYCADCRKRLCEGHAYLHQRSRETHAHDLVDVQDAPSPTSDRPSVMIKTAACSVHPREGVSHFCSECNEVNHFLRSELYFL